MLTFAVVVCLAFYSVIHSQDYRWASVVWSRTRKMGLIFRAGGRKRSRLVSSGCCFSLLYRLSSTLNPWQVLQLKWASFMLHAFVSVVCGFALAIFFFFGCCGWMYCMWDRCQGAVKLWLQQWLEIKRFNWRLAHIVLLSDMRLWRCATHT